MLNYIYYMSRKQANTVAGKSVASDIQPFIKANRDDMKDKGRNRDAEKNEEIAIEDLSNEIASAARNMTDKRGVIEAAKALTRPELLSSLDAVTVPITGTALATILKSVFLPLSKLEEL
jgi:hypothetical protein